MRITLIFAVFIMLSGSIGLAQEATVRNQEIAKKLNLYSWQEESLAVPTHPGSNETLVLRLDGVEYLLALEHQNLRAADFTVWEVEHGSKVRVPEQEIAPPTTYSGTVAFLDTGEIVGRASASLEEGTLEALIHLEGTSMIFGVQPRVKFDSQAEPSRHLIYSTLWDKEPVQGTCANTATAPGQNTYFGGGGSRAAGDLRTDISFDADFDFYNWAGGTRKKTIRSIEKVMIDVREIYERDVDISYEITSYIVRKTAGADPYSTTDPGGLLTQFRNEWEANNSDHRYDVAHLMTGRNLDGSTIGIANLSVICNASGFAYGVSQSSYTSNAADRAGLTAHELGHNWSAGHCDGAGDCFIMCSGIGGCANDVTQFGSNSIASITNHKNSRTCLENDGGPATLPFFDDFELGSDLDVSKWNYNRNGKALKGGANEPSGERSLKLNATSADGQAQDDVRSVELLLGGETCATLTLWVQHQGVESGEQLKIKYYPKGKNWGNIDILASDGVDQTSYVLHTYPLPDNAFHDRFRLRFKPAVDELNDKWFVDDVSIVACGGALIPSPEGDSIQGIGLQPGDTLALLAVGASPAPLLVGSAVADSRGHARIFFPVPDTPGLQFHGIVFPHDAREAHALPPFIR